MVGRAAAKELHPLFRKHSGDDQFGLQADGTGKLHRLLQAIAHTRPGVGIWATVIADAITTTSRTAVILECEEAHPLWGLCPGCG